jgi:hypothetical protein
VRELVLARRAGAIAVAAACGALIAAPAWADVAVSPAVAAQGTGQDFNFHVTNTGTQPIATIKLTLPADAPIAEAYPLSTDNWAPKITTRQLSTALPTIHTGIPTNEATGAITWIAMPGHLLAVGQSADLKISVGPLPTLSSMKFTVDTTYAGGKAGPPMSPLNITLNPPTSAEIAAEHAGHDESATGDGTDSTATGDDAENAQFAQVVAEATRGPSVLSIGGWVLLALALVGGGVWLMFRSRHRAEEDDEPEDEELTLAGNAPEAVADADAVSDADAAEDAKEPVAAGKWSLKE